jgi:hypothetical protein
MVSLSARGGPFPWLALRRLSPLNATSARETAAVRRCCLPNERMNLQPLIGASPVIRNSIMPSGARNVHKTCRRSYCCSRTHFLSLKTIKVRSFGRLEWSGALDSRSARIFRNANRATGQWCDPSLSINRAWRIDLRTISSIRGSIVRTAAFPSATTGTGGGKRGAVDVRRQSSRFGAERVPGHSNALGGSARRHAAQFGIGVLDPRISH